MEPSKEYVRKCLELADEFLEDAKLSLKHHRLRSAVNNAYYAMFHASQAILAAKGLSPPKTHKGLRELLGREFIKTGLLEKNSEKDFSKAFEMRQASTYDVFATYSEEEVKIIVERAEQFISRIKKLLKTLHPL